MQYTNLQNNFSKICLSLLTPTKFNQIHSNKKDSPDESIDKNIQWITSDPFNSTIEGSLWLLQVKVGRLYYFFSFEKHERLASIFHLCGLFYMLHTKTIMSWQEHEHYVTFGQAMDWIWNLLKFYQVLLIKNSLDF